MALSDRRLLVTRPLGLGDLCTGVPALRALARAFPDHEFVLAAPAWQTPIARQCGVQRIVDVGEFDPLPADEIGPVDVAVNLHGCGPESTRRLVAVDPGRVVAYRHDSVTATRHGPHWCRNEHEVDRWCRLLEHHGIACDAGDLRLEATAQGEPPGTVIIHPGAASASRRWPAERFAAVARAVSDTGKHVVLTGSSTEAESCAAIATAAGRPQVESRAGTTDLEALCGLVAGARLVVSNDTGIAHLAAAFTVASVTLFGPTAPGRWAPRNAAPHRHLWSGREGDPHGTELDPGLSQITVDDVVEAIHDVLDAT